MAGWLVGLIESRVDVGWMEKWLAGRMDGLVLGDEESAFGFSLSVWCLLIWRY